MKILIVSPYLPYPLNSGGNQAVFAMIDYLRRKQDITFITTVNRRNSEHFQTLQALWDNVKFRPYHASKNEQMICDAAKYYGGEPDTFTYKLLGKIERSAVRKMRRRRAAMESPDAKRSVCSLNQYFGYNLPVAFLEFVREEILTGNYDIVQTEFYDMLPLGYIIPREQTSVFVHHELRFVRNRNEINLFANPTLVDEFLYQSEKDRELAALGKFSHIITLSETDEQLLRRELPDSQIHTSPAIIFRQQGEAVFRPGSTDLVFAGSDEHYPNRDAVEWFCREIAPLVEQPFTLHIVGNWSRRAKERLQTLPFVRFAGFVDDLTAFLNGKIMIVPIRIGSGIRMKILDSIAAKTPFITTAKGVEGLDFRNGEECIIADDAKGFAAAVDSLLRNTGLQERLQANAFAKLSSLYNPDTILERRNSLYEHIYAASHTNDFT